MPFVNGREDWGPCQQHVAYGDPVAGLYAAAAAMVGLYARERLGGGDIELCQVECLFQLGRRRCHRRDTRRARAGRARDRAAPEMAPCCVVAATARDAWLTVAVDSDAAWRALALAIGRADLAADAALATLAGRKAREDEIEAAIAAWAADRDPREAAAALQEAGVAASAVDPDPRAVRRSAPAGLRLLGLQFRRYIDDHFTPQPPFRYDGERPPLVRPAPTLGEHTDEVLAELGIARVIG